MPNELEQLRAKVAMYERRAHLYCPLAREINVDNARLRALVGEHRAEDRDMIFAEVEQLQRERDWAVEALAAATGRSVDDTRMEMRTRFNFHIPGLMESP